MVEGLACGGVDYVTKPIVLEELLARIRVHLGNARLAHETRAALDASGRFLLATDRAGRVLWCTPKARQLLASWRPRQPGPTLPATVIEQLLRMRRGDRQAPARCLVDHRRAAAGVLVPELRWVRTSCCSASPRPPTPTAIRPCCSAPSR